MELRTTLLLLMLTLICLLMCAEAEAARPGGRQGGRPRVRAGAQGRPRPRGRVKGHKRGPVRVKSHLKVGKPVVHTKEPERTPVYLEVAGEAHPIPVYPLAPGSGHQPFTVRVASPHLADDPVSGAGAGAGDGAGAGGSSTPFQPSQPVQFDASDASRTSAAEGLSPLPPVSPASSPESQLNSFGSSFFDTSAGFGDGFGRAPPRFPDFATTFQGSRSRRRGARKLFPPALTADVDLPHSNGKESFRPSTGTLDEYLEDQPLHSSYSDLNSDSDSDADSDSNSDDQYQFGYLVDGRRESGAAFGLQQSAADGVTRGRYEVQLPDGRTQVVTYTAGGERGYEADVSYVERTHPAAPTTAAAATAAATVVEGAR